LGISNANIGALGEQSKALQTGYAQALAAAQEQRKNQLTAGSTAGTLQNQFNTNRVTAGQIAGNAAEQQATNQRNVGLAQAALADQTQKQGLADVNALATLGEQERTLKENKVLAPLDILNKRASILSGATIPTSTTTQFDPSTLSTISTLVATGAGIYNKPVIGKNADGTPIYGESLWDRAKGSLSSTAGDGSGNRTASNTFQSSDGKWYPTQAARDAADTLYMGNFNDSNSDGGSTRGTIRGPNGQILTSNGNGGYTDSDGIEYDSNGYPV
jgi:hypothetical protein